MQTLASSDALNIQPESSDADYTAPVTLAHILGEISLLFAQSPMHRHFAFADMEWLIMPPLVTQQYRLFRGPQGPIGVILWASLSPEAERKLASTRPRLAPEDWTSGDRLWVVEVIAPTATPENQLVARLLTELTQTALAGKAISFHKTDPATGQREAVTLTPEMIAR